MFTLCLNSPPGLQYYISFETEILCRCKVILPLGEFRVIAFMFWIMKTNALRHVELSKIAVNTISGWENCISLDRIMKVKCHSAYSVSFTWARIECS